MKICFFVPWLFFVSCLIRASSFENIDGCAGLAIEQMMKSEWISECVLVEERGKKQKQKNKTKTVHISMHTHIEKSNRIRSGADCLENTYGANEKSNENDRIKAEGYV